MPRARKTQTGQAAQPAVPVAGQTYGMGVEQQRLQEAMPLPNTAAPTAPAAPPVQVGAQPEPGIPGAPQPQPSLQELLAQASAMSPGGLLHMPSSRPNEPVTHGLASGPGAGPEVLAQPVGTPYGRWIRNLAQRTGDPALQQIADRIGM